VAGDLIPPPSPAGRPPADVVAEPQVTARLAKPVQPEAEPARRTPAPFRGRFGFAWGALAGIALCAAGVLVLLLTAPRDEGPVLAANWSRWQPETERMVEGAQDIARQVGLRYKLDSGDQLVQVASSALELGGEPIGVAVRPSGGELVMLEGDGLLYVLNGLGPNGQLPTGKPSKKRGRLLMREALELALYSFRYLDDVTMVAVLMPQTAEQAAAATESAPPRNVIFYRPGDLLEELQVPLDRTLSPNTPRPSTMSKAEAARVDSLTLRNLFLGSMVPLETDRSYLVLVEPDAVQ
jgi:hypothetical protein